MRGGWNKGLTKETDASVQRISETMRARKIDNFKRWREKAKKAGRMKNAYPPLNKNGDLAELIGVILGDGHIGQHPRCQSLRITGNCLNTGFMKRYASLVEKVFEKKPAVAKVKASNAAIITIYEKNISERLGIPTGGRFALEYTLPTWIRKNKNYQIRFLRGLYEAEGSLCYHAATYTHKLFFSNRNPSLLSLVFELVSRLGFKANMRKYEVYISRKQEVQDLSNLLEFRRYGS